MFSGLIDNLIRRTRVAMLGVAASLISVVPAGSSALAQSMKPGGDGTPIQNPSDNQPKFINSVGIDQKLGAQVPGHLEFKDDFGKPVKLADYFAKGKPVLFTLVYFECPRTCTAALNEMTKAMKAMPFVPGADFEVVVVSFDPREGPKIASEKKANYQRFYNRNAVGSPGWNFLTGDEANIKALRESVGFRYTWDEKHQQYVHAAGVMVLTPDGKISRYFYGVEYQARDLRLALGDASGGKIGSAAEAVLRLCYEFDPTTGKYSLSILWIVRIFGIVMALGVGFFVVRSLIRERSGPRLAAAAGSDATAIEATEAKTDVAADEPDSQPKP